jgi:predicted transcriptional regulator
MRYSGGMLTRTVTVTLRLDADTVAKIEALAAKHDVAPTAYIRQLCQDIDSETEQLRRPA